MKFTVEEQNKHRKELLNQNLIASIDVIMKEAKELKDGQCLYGVIKWNIGLSINPSRYPLSDSQMQSIRKSLGQNNCVFRYFPGKPLELLF